jgi:uncharacterized FlaG/YvyC family protein
MSDKYSDLKKAAEACKDLLPLRYMGDTVLTYIRNDYGVVFDVHQNRSFPGLMEQNKAYADLALAAQPATILDLIGRLEVSESMEGLYTSTVTVERAELEQTKRERDKLAEVVEQQKALIASLRNDMQEAIAIDCDDDAKDACAEVERTGTPGSVIREMNDELVDLRARLAERDAQAIERAAKWVDRRLDEYVRDHGMQDPDTGTMEFPGDGAEYVEELDFIASSIRSLSTSAEPSAPDCLTCSDHGAVGNILNAEPCPDCTQITKMEV